MKRLFKFLREKKVRQKLKELGVKQKVDLVQEIKWLSFYQAFSFIRRFKAEVENVLADKTMRARKRPTFTTIPETWYAYMQALAPLGEFILKTEKSDTRLCDVFSLLSELKTNWDQFDSDVSRMLSTMMATRFERTADGLLMQHGVPRTSTPLQLRYLTRSGPTLTTLSSHAVCTVKTPTDNSSLCRKTLELETQTWFPCSRATMG